MPSLSNTSVALTTAGLVGISLVSGGVMGLFGGNQMPVDGKTVLLTGASEGMGRCVAKQLAAQGAHVIVVARNVERLEETVAELKVGTAFGEYFRLCTASDKQAVATSPTQRFHHISADVAQPDYATAVVANAVAWNSGAAIDVVWCIAGMATPMLFAEESRDVALGAMRRNMDVNLYGHAEMAHAILRAWLHGAPFAGTGPRHLVFTASVVAFFGIVGYTPYTPSKWALRGLADSLAQEVLLYEQTHPVRVSVVYPGTILSPGLERENATKPEITLQLEKDDPKLTPEAVAAAAIRGLQRGDHFVTVSFLGNLMRCGVLGGSIRNNVVVDTLLGWIVTLVMAFVVWWMHGDIRTYAKKRGHPSTYAKRE